jgi:hypothetical protein
MITAGLRIKKTPPPWRPQVLFGALLVIVLEVSAFSAASGLRRTVPALAESARKRQRRALLLLLAALVIFAALTAGPALHWRIVHGVWMH